VWGQASHMIGGDQFPLAIGLERGDLLFLEQSVGVSLKKLRRWTGRVSSLRVDGLLPRDAIRLGSHHIVLHFAWGPHDLRYTS
jgi:hypothetical protein